MQRLPLRLSRRVRHVVARMLVGFGAACAGMFTGFVGSAIVVVPIVGPGPSATNLAAALAVGLGVAGAISSLAVPVRGVRMR
jgi:hypothetical protein